MKPHIQMLAVLLVIAGIVSLAALVPEQSLDGAPVAEASTRAKPASFWKARYVKAHKALSRHGEMVRSSRKVARNLRRSLVHSSSSLEAIRLAAITYRQSAGDLLRVASCESPGLSATLVNSSPVWNGEHATGLFQFLPSTFRSTPYRSESIFSPYANALAAGWMWANGRRGEWACR